MKTFSLAAGALISFRAVADGPLCLWKLLLGSYMADLVVVFI